MKNDDKLEQLLRKAPTPPAPFGLEERLIRQVSMPERKVRWTLFSLFSERRWSPALALFLVLASLLTVLGVQQNTLMKLKLPQEKSGSQALSADEPSRAHGQGTAERELIELQKQSAEVQQLRAEMEEIQKTLDRQPAIASENAALRAELSNLTKNNPALSPEYQTALAEARKKAERIKCVNNLKNIGLAARIWATDNAEKNQLPSDFLTIRNELSTPKILMCPSDPSRTQPIQSWEQFGSVGASYEMISPGIAEAFPAAVYVHCPFHHNVCRVDGSVMQLRPEQQLVERNGHWEVGE